MSEPENDLPPPLPKSQPQGFKLHPVNFILLIIAVTAVCALTWPIAKEREFASSYLIGTGVGVLLFPALFGWIFYRVGKRNSNGGNIAFGLVLCLTVGGQLFSNLKQKQRSAEDPIGVTMNELNQERDQMLKGVTNLMELDDTELEDFQNRREERIDNALDQMTAEASGSRKEILARLGKLRAEIAVERAKWDAAWTAIVEDRFLDFSRYKQEGEIKWQLETVNHYLKAATNYHRFSRNVPTTLQERLKPYYPDDKFARDVSRGATRKHLQERPILDHLFKHHFGYGTHMRTMIELIEADGDAWQLTDDGVQLSTGAKQEEYDAALQEVIKHEEGINHYTTEALKIQ